MHRHPVLSLAVLALALFGPLALVASARHAARAPEAARLAENVPDRVAAMLATTW
jgi:hypothetical protein